MGPNRIKDYLVDSNVHSLDAYGDFGWPAKAGRCQLSEAHVVSLPQAPDMVPWWLIRDRGTGWAAGSPFDCTPDEARQLARAVCATLCDAREVLADARAERDLSAAERMVAQLGTLRERQRWSEEAQRHQERCAAELERRERDFVMELVQRYKSNESELKGLRMAQKREARLACMQELREQMRQYQREVEALRKRHQRLRLDLRERQLQAEHQATVAALMPVNHHESVEELRRCMQIAEWGDGYRLCDQSYVASVLRAAESGGRPPLEGDRLRLVCLLRQVLDEHRGSDPCR